MIPAHAPPHNTHELVKSLAILVKEKERVKEIFEDKVKTILQTERYLTVSSGRRALYIGLKGLEIGKGDEVILPAFTTDIVPMVIRETAQSNFLVIESRTVFHIQKLFGRESLMKQIILFLTQLVVCNRDQSFAYLRPFFRPVIHKYPENAWNTIPAEM